MKKESYKKAELLARRPYQAHVFMDETTDGETVYVAVVPEMPGCIAHGDTVEEALQWLDSAKLDHIWFLLDHKLEVPAPQLIGSRTVFNVPQHQDQDSGMSAASGGLIVSSVPV